MPHGYNGKILHIDLTNRTFEVEAPPESFYRKYMGGSAMGMHYVLNQTPANTDPLGPDNVLCLTRTSSRRVHGAAKPSSPGGRWFRCAGRA